MLALAGLAGCLSIHVVPPPDAGGADAAPSPAAGPSLSPGAVVDVFYVDAADEYGAMGQATLAAGAAYLVTVEGTYSAWAPHHWRSVCAGRPEPGPQFRSGRRTGPVGIDAAHTFAVPSVSTICDRPAPASRAGWAYRLRPGDPWALAPSAVPYDAGHAYRFPFVGAGAPFEVVVRDAPGEYADNYGRLRITVHDAG